MKRFMVAVFAFLMMAGCAANKIDYNSRSLQLGIGMSKSEVLGILGEPRRTDVNQDRERWIYWNRVLVGFTPVDNESLAQDRLVVTFKEGKVSRWGNQTLADDMAEVSQKAIESSYKAAQEMQKSAH
ncbi:outer membrane protein assembly factor BamE [Alcaligenes sp. WGS1538]|uniref:outer membrane protein assembly factor BamE domain-containing protein n=1 Tax=Alcaligenes sp. WGS1538 TaxID=3366811 RepID=UPI00372D1783